MNSTTEQLAHAVLLPAVADIDSSVLAPLIERGCRSVLLGETRDEYLARTMSERRASHETREVVTSAIAGLRALTPDRLLVVVDHEVVGIRRFEHLIPDPATAGTELASLGIDVVLGPIVDVVRGPNPWLEGRNLGTDSATVAAVARAEVEALQSAGVAAVAKHYPGHAVTRNDPAVDLGNVPTELTELDTIDEEPFAAVVGAGVRGLMLGPAVIDAIDPEETASCSPVVAARARRRLGFQGTLVSDDLDAVSILRGRKVGEVAVKSLSAGLDLLLVPASVAPECAAAIVEAVDDGRLPLDRLTEAAAQVEALGEP